tara:strand:+ start:2477 stop:2689 length:213 start_codon:yes stop_codon:yes gene_type:complete
MGDNIDKLIIKLKKELTKEYGNNFKKFYLVNNEDKKEWEGLISTTNEGERNVQYYTVEKKEVIKDEKLLH